MAKTRDHYFDNARFLLIVLVVFGHLLRSFVTENHFLQALYMFIYSFHMPAFVLISGYFAKGISRPGYLLKLVKKLIIPYLIFQTFYACYYYFIDDVKTIDLNPFDPQWAMWFLLSLFSWHILLYLVKDFNVYYVVVLAFLTGILVGYFDFINNTLSLSRTFVFFPLFLLGYYATPEHFSYIKNKKYLPLSILALTLIFVFYMMTDFNFEWLFGSKPYSSLEHVDAYSGVKRGLIYGIIVLSTFSFLNVVPKRELPLTYIGSRTMFIYLLHGLFIGLFRVYKWDKVFEGNMLLIIVALFVLSTLIVYLFSHNMTRKVTAPVVEVKNPLD
ncbi:acyltransferase family protein [Macrococcus equipercicus]|uniref:Acyltransferase family protein n=1 Tax=Macrococcus equipercicus TaxID=69967 RepID=A0A9Q9BWR2_9STAP|nr:acyltransferase family protein [Macrococcus equipercicus]KAA1042621.1 acyltransferase family protein [Macrococcus equipercicus]UTH14483.1 acyltransferase family protein [Macrococcus equipercicus]